MKAGAVAVPFDPMNHKDRLAGIVADCKPVVLLHHAHTSDLAAYLTTSHPTITTINVSKLPSNSQTVTNKSSADAMGAVFYTSGTTGKPKGAIITQANYIEVIASLATAIGLRFGMEILMQHTPLGFDLSIMQIFLTLATANTLVVASKHERVDPSAIAELARTWGVTCMASTPTQLKHMLQEASTTIKQCSKLTKVLVGGEVFTTQLAKLLQQAIPQRVDVYNMYGPTETCILSSAGLVEYWRDDMEHIPVGQTLNNISVYIVDEALTLVPDGCAGEICIAGAGVGLGYLNREDETSKAFVPSPFATHEDVSHGWTTMYRTGDSGFINPDRSLVVLGRLCSDSQIKVRGIRIELDDIASTILTTAVGKLSEAVVTVRGEVQMLVAFCVVDQDAKSPDTNTFLASLAASLPLPEYMRPATIIPLEKLPINTHGKLDRAALGRIPLLDNRNSHDALSSLEKDLRIVWIESLPKDLLGTFDIQPSSDFFRIGGNSMLLVSLRKRIQRKWSVPVTLLQLFEASTLRSMASLVKGMANTKGDTDKSHFWDNETHFYLYPKADLQQKTTPTPTSGDKMSVLLTGAASRIGCLLLQSLLDDTRVAKVHCLALSLDDQAKLPKNEKIAVYTGHLGDARLGLSEEEEQYLRRTADKILHAGADGSCLNNYESFRSQNVDSTKFLASLALDKMAPLHFVSSARVVLFSGEISWHEASVSAFYPPVDEGREGFTCTKWASERYLENCARQTGLPVCIHRTGYLISEDADEMDAISMILKYSTVMSAIPSMNSFSGFLDMCEITVAGSAIAHSVLDDVNNSGELVKFIHHTQDKAVPIHSVRQYMERQFERAFDDLSLSDWAVRARLTGMSPVLEAFLQAIVDRGDRVRYPRLLKGSKPS